MNSPISNIDLETSTTTIVLDKEVRRIPNLDLEMKVSETAEKIRDIILITITKAIKIIIIKTVRDLKTTTMTITMMIPMLKITIIVTKNMGMASTRPNKICSTPRKISEAL